MSAFYGAPEGEEIKADAKVKPQADVKPVDDPNLIWGAGSVERRDFTANGYEGPERRNRVRGILDPEAANRLREWT